MSEPLFAQRPRSADSFWVGLALGVGWGRVGCDICSRDRDLAPVATLRMGVTPADGLRIGGQASAWKRADGDVDRLLGSLGILAYWYPNPELPLHIQLGLGLVGYRADDDEDALTATALGPQVGLAYDLRVAEGLALTPYFSYAATIANGELHFNGGAVTSDLSLSLVQLGLGLTWR